MTTDTTRVGVHSDQDADELRDAMVDEVIVDREWVGVVPREVEAALRTVPRHLFTPEVSLEEAYADRSIVTKRTERGAPISSVSAPHIQAMMLGQLQVAAGQRVLEFGSGGYNAALLREMVGPSGSVTTVDIDQEVVDRAHACLASAGYRDMRVVCANGELGAPEYGPFDRIIVTAGTWGIPPAWVEQLAEGGRLVVPLWTKGLGGPGRWNAATGTWPVVTPCRAGSCRCRAPADTGVSRSRSRSRFMAARSVCGWANSRSIPRR